VPMTPAPSAPAAEPAEAGRVRASPLARKIAAQAGLDLHRLQGSGPAGRIVRRDVEAALAAPRPAAPAIAVPRPAAPASPGVAAPRPPERRTLVVPSRPEVESEDVALTPMRALIARRMPLSKGPIPHFYITAEAAMDRAMDLRAELNGLEGQPKASVTDL